MKRSLPQRFRECLYMTAEKNNILFPAHLPCIQSFQRYIFYKLFMSLWTSDILASRRWTLLSPWRPYINRASAHARSCLRSLRILYRGIFGCPIMTYGHCLLFTAKPTDLEPLWKTERCALCIINRTPIRIRNRTLIQPPLGDFIGVLTHCYAANTCTIVSHWQKPSLL